MIVLTETNVSGYSCRRGKVRDIYDLGDKIVLVSTDRLSAFDQVVGAIPNKGVILTKLTRIWLSRLAELALPNHLISADLKEFPSAFQQPELEGRSMLCWKMDRVIPFECIVRGYVTGSGLKDYQQNGHICGIELPPGLRNCEKLPEPIFTPSTKAETGHDENVSFEVMKQVLGCEVARQLRNWSLALYQTAHDYALRKGIIIADTKFEFGVMDNQLMLIDEVLTPDSSRFWPAETYEPGRTQPSLDKQPIRDHLQALCDAGKWDKNPPAPSLPSGLVSATSDRYRRIYRLLNGESLQ